MDKQKYEREIEEILEKYDKESGRKTRTEKPLPGPSSFRPVPTVPSRPNFSVPPLKSWKRFSSGQFMAAAFVVAFIGVLVRNISHDLATALVIAAVVLFLVPLFLYRSTGTTSGGYSPIEQKRWRGQVIDFNTRRPVNTNSPVESIRRWLNRR